MSRYGIDVPQLSRYLPYIVSVEPVSVASRITSCKSCPSVLWNLPLSHQDQAMTLANLMADTQDDSRAASPLTPCTAPASPLIIPSSECFLALSPKPQLPRSAYTHCKEGTGFCQQRRVRQPFVSPKQNIVRASPSSLCIFFSRSPGLVSPRTLKTTSISKESSITRFSKWIRVWTRSLLTRFASRPN